MFNPDTIPADPETAGFIDRVLRNVDPSESMLPTGAEVLHAERPAITNERLESMGGPPAQAAPKQTFNEIDRVLAGVQSMGLPQEAAIRVLQARGIGPEQIKKQMEFRQALDARAAYEDNLLATRAEAKAKLAKTLAESYRDPRAAAANSGINLPGEPFSPARESRDLQDRRDRERAEYNSPLAQLQRALASKGHTARRNEETGELEIVALPGSEGLNRTKPMPPRVGDKLIEASTQAGTVRGLIKSFDQAYAGDVVPVWGEVKNIYSSYVPGADTGRGNWWRDYRNLEEITRRHEFFGSAFTPTEQKAWNGTAINPGLPPETVQRYLEIRLGIMANALDRRAQEAAKQYGAEPVSAAIGRDVPQGRISVPQELEDFRKYGMEGPRAATQAAPAQGARPSLQQLLEEVRRNRGNRTQ